MREYLSKHSGSAVFLATEDAENRRYITTWPKDIQKRVKVRQLPDASLGAVFDQGAWGEGKKVVSKGSGKERAIDVLIDLLMLARCDCLVTGVSSIGEMAHAFARGRLHDRSLHVTHGGQAQQWARCLTQPHALGK